MAEKAIRLGGESTADAIVSAVDSLYPEHTFEDKEFALKHNDDEIAVDTNFAAQSFWKDAILRFFGKRSAVLGLILIVVIVLLAVFGPGMNSYTYSGQDLSQKNFAPRVPGIERLGILDGSEKMSTTTGSKSVNAYVEKGKDDVYYWFGSDLYGRDIWTRTWEGARVSLIIAVAAAVIDMVIGMSYGLISGYFGGRVDMVMQRFLEVANGIPRLVIVTLLLLVLQPGMVTIIFALMLTEWVGMSRIARAEMLKLKDQEFVLASRTLGAGSFFIIFKEVLPNIIGPIITQVMFSIPTAIFTEAFLSFVGLGIPVPQCSLGSLISELYNSFTTHPYQIIPPIVVMSLLMLSFNLVADGLREALDPTMQIGKQIMEGMLWHFKMPKDQAYKKAVELLEEVGITDAEKRMKNYPHQLSGGMRQRVMIAMALANHPDLLIADEPTTALDVTIQHQILKQMRSLQEEYGTSIIFITHDLGVVAELCDRVVVLYGGLVMEEAEINDLFENPLHPYTMGLLASIPGLTKDKSERLQSIPGSPPDMTKPPKGCPFASRCQFARNICAAECPPFVQVGSRQARCWLLQPDAPAEGNPLHEKLAEAERKAH